MMRSSRGDGRPEIAEADPDAPPCIRIAIADAAFVTEGIALGLPLKWIERAPLSEHRPPLVVAWRTRDGGTRVPADR